MSNPSQEKKHAKVIADRRDLQARIKAEKDPATKKQLEILLEENKNTKIGGKLARDRKAKPSGSPSMIKMGAIANQVNQKLQGIGFLEHIKSFLKQDILFVNHGLERANIKLRELYVSFTWQCISNIHRVAMKCQKPGLISWDQTMCLAIHWSRSWSR